MAGPEGHVSERFIGLLALYRKPDGSACGGQDLEDATAREILGEVLRLGSRDRRLLLSIARQIASPSEDGPR